MPKLEDLGEFSGDDNVYEVEKIVGVHRQPGKPTLYRVRWKGYGPEEDTYEPRDHLLTCEDMIDDYLLEEKKKAEELAIKKEKKKPAKRKHSGEGSSPSSPNSSKSLTEETPGISKQEDDSPSSPASGDVTVKTEEDDDSDVDRRALLKDPFWNDLENGFIVPNLFETDMYSKVKSRRATLEAKRKKEEEESDEQPKASGETSSECDKSSSSDASKKKDSPSKGAEESKKHKKKKHSDKHEHGKKKKKKKDRKDRRRKRVVKMDLEAIGSLESATQKSLKMSPSDLDGSDNSANLFISCKPAEEVVTVEQLEQSRQNSSNGSQSSDGSDDADKTDKSSRGDSQDQEETESTTDKVQADKGGEVDCLSPDLEKIFEKNPFSLSDETDTELVGNLSSKKVPSLPDQSAPPSTSKDDTSSGYEPGPSLWDHFSKEFLPQSSASSSLASTVNLNPSFPPLSQTTSSSSPVQVAATLNSNPPQFSNGLGQTQPSVGNSNHTLGQIPTTVPSHTPSATGQLPQVKQEPTEDIPGTSVKIKQEFGDISHVIGDGSNASNVTAPVIKKEPLDATSVTESLEPSLVEPKSEHETAVATVPKQESLEIPDSIEDHLTSEPVLENVLKSNSLGTAEELPNLTGNLFDSFLPANSPFTDDEQRTSGSEEPKIDVNQLLSSLDEKEQPQVKALLDSKDLPSATEPPTAKNILSEKHPVAVPEKLGTKDDATSKAESKLPEKNTEDTHTPEAGGLNWPWSGTGPLTSPTGVNKERAENQSSSQEVKEVEDVCNESVQNVTENTAQSNQLHKTRERGGSSPVSTVPELTPLPPAVPLPQEQPEGVTSMTASMTEEAVTPATVSKDEGETDSTTSAKGHDGNILTNSVKNGANKEKLDSEKNIVGACSVDTTKEPPSEESKEEKSENNAAASTKVSEKEKSSRTQNKQVKKQASSKRKHSGTSAVSNVAKNVRKDQESSEKNQKEKISGKIADEGMDKGTDKIQSTKEQELSKKQLHEKAVAKLKKKISEGAWKFDCITEIPKNDENQMPMEALDKSTTLDEDYLCQAISAGEVRLVYAILHHKPNLHVDRPNSRGQRPIVLACRGGHNEILKKLILSRASVDVKLNNGVTPLMIAAEQGFTATAGILLEAGASVNLTNSSGETALIKASRRGHLDVVQLLLQYGADWGQTSLENTSALSLAKQHKQYQVSELLQKHEQRMVEQLEYGIAQYMWGTARLVHSVLPSRCFRIRESTQHCIKFNFDPSKIPFSPTLGTMLFLCHVSPGPSGMSCHLTGPCHVKEVTLNGVRTNPIPEGNGFVMEFIPKAGSNILNITTYPDPYTKMLLVVTAYSLQLIQS
ncbi:M-phase phosphoprotein 8 [Holothuria leucospilota]|uniref:M-phase phosphoprotein 8 n=1 Tax=Holothuria leucospilota TaxID=206669 RepID=A0A9Q1BIP0_HOLLE|nr:M-phase phosphoprotein 8 [Holothuria leucospilota]